MHKDEELRDPLIERRELSSGIAELCQDDSGPKRQASEIVGGMERLGDSVPRIVLFNFFEGILLRGIPVYAGNLREALERHGVYCQEVVCPPIFRRLPRPMLNLLFIIYEQVVMPIYSISYDGVIYPYNSVSIIDSLRRRSLLIVHDFILLARRNRRFVARYIRLTQAIHRCLADNVAYVSRSSERLGRSSGRFRRSRTYLFPNGFYTFMRALPAIPSERQNHILLCSGWGANKDLSGALNLYRDSGLWRRQPLRILGIAGHSEAVDTFRSLAPEVAANITVLPRLQDTQVGEQYYAAAWVWVHSMKEGYGRSIAEARLCGCRVVASDIAPFREQRDRAVFLYRGLDGFVDAASRCEASGEIAPVREPREHAILRQEISRYLKDLHANGY